MPRKLPNKDFIVAGLRRIAQDKSPNPTQLKALNILAVLCGFLSEDALIRTYGAKSLGKQIEEPPAPAPQPEPEDEEIASRLAALRSGGNNVAATSTSKNREP